MMASLLEKTAPARAAMIITRFRPRTLVPGLMAAMIVLAACGGQSSPTTPSDSTPSTPASPPAGGSTPATGLTGSWSGTAADNSGAGSMEWALSETGGVVSGTVTLVDATAGVRGRGTVSGTLSGSTVTFTLSVPAGGFDAPFATCSASITGQGTLADTTLTATYAGSNSCSGAVTGGVATLTKA